MSSSFVNTQSVAVLGGGPGGYEAALAAAQLGAEVTLVERAGVGGAAVITDVVPSKSLIATADAAVAIAEASDLGVQLFAHGESGRPLKPEIAINLAAVNKRLMSLARQQSDDMRAQLVDAGVRIISGHGRLDDHHSIIVATGPGGTDFDRVEADTLVEADFAQHPIAVHARDISRRFSGQAVLDRLDLAGGEAARHQLAELGVRGWVLHDHGRIVGEPDQIQFAVVDGQPLRRGERLVVACARPDVGVPGEHVVVVVGPVGRHDVVDGVVVAQRPVHRPRFAPGLGVGQLKPRG